MRIRLSNRTLRLCLPLPLSLGLTLRRTLLSNRTLRWCLALPLSPGLTLRRTLLHHDGRRRSYDPHHSRRAGRRHGI